MGFSLMLMLYATFSSISCLDWTTSKDDFWGFVRERNTLRDVVIFSIIKIKISGLLIRTPTCLVCFQKRTIKCPIAEVKWELRKL